MSTKSITASFHKAGVLTDVTSMKFSDPSGTYGMRRRDTLAVNVADDTSLDRSSTGVYSKTISDLVAGVEYEYWIERTYSGVTKWFDFIFTASDVGVTPTARYTTYSHFLRKWGIKNVAEASEKDNKATTPNLLAIQDAFDYADDEIDTALLGGVLKVPLDFAAWGAAVPKSVVNWEETIAYGYLYETRGWQEKNPKNNRVKELVERVYQEMQLVRSGLKQINAFGYEDSSGEQVSFAGQSIAPLAVWTRYPDGTWFLTD